MAATARMEFRIKPDSKCKIEQAAELVHESAGDFARSAAEARAEEVLREHLQETKVPSDFFDALLAALDEPPRSTPALAGGAKLTREVVEHRP